MARYESADDAGIAALDKANPIAIRKLCEFGGLIFRDQDDHFGFTPPVAGNHDHFDPTQVQVPSGTVMIGNYHCHGDYTAFRNREHVRTDREHSMYSARGFGINGYDADTFSIDDEMYFLRESRTIPDYCAYLGTASGAYLVWRRGMRRSARLPRRTPQPVSTAIP